MISKKDKAKIEDFREVFRMIVNTENNEDINKVVDDLFKNVEFNYEEYKDEVPYVSVNQETYKYHILQPVDGKYSLLDFLLNRAISNVEKILINECEENGNAYYTKKCLNISKKRYERQRVKYANDFIEKQYIRSRLHETGHALHALDVKQDNTIHSGVDLKKRIQLFNERLGYKYTNLLQKNQIENKSYDFAANWRGNKRAFVFPNLDEASTEYFATKYSGLFFDSENYGISYICETENKTEGVLVPNHFNGYSTGACLMFHLGNLVSKKAMFQSNFFSDDSALNEFLSRYIEQIEKVLNSSKGDLEKKLPEANVYNIKGKFKFFFDKACTAQPNGCSKENQEKISVCYEIINKIFAYLYVQEYNNGRITKDKMLQLLPLIKTLTPIMIDKETGEWKDTRIKEGYKEFERRLKENKTVNQIKPNSISNVTIQTIQTNPGELSKKVQNVSKSFYDSLKQNGYTQDDDIQKNRSGLRYAQIDEYNRKKHGRNR